MHNVKYANLFLLINTTVIEPVLAVCHIYCKLGILVESLMRPLVSSSDWPERVAVLGKMQIMPA